MELPNSNNYKICIPSYNRIDILKEKTLTMLSNNNISKDNIYIFVPLENYQDYYNHFKDYKVFFCPNRGLVAQRDYIMTYCILHNINYCVMLDDDIDRLIRKDGDINPIKDEFTDFEALIKIGFGACLKHNANIWGLYPVDNGYFMKDTITTDLKFIQGTAYGIIPKISSFMKWKDDICEDFARTLHYYEKDGKVIRINYIAPVTNFAKTKGGYQDVYESSERLELEKEAFKLLHSKYPHLSKIFHKKNGRDILKLHHYKDKKGKLLNKWNMDDEKMKNSADDECENKIISSPS